MTLDSGDRIFFNITPSGMTLQVISHDNLKEDDEALEMKGDCDTVQLNGSNVARLLYWLTSGSYGSVDRVWVETDRGKLEKVVKLETDDNVVTMTEYERDMFVSAIKSQAWRLFQ